MGISRRGVLSLASATLSVSALVAAPAFAQQANTQETSQSTVAPSVARTRCSRDACISVDGNGLRVNSATVRNISRRTDFGWITDSRTRPGRYESRTRLRPGQMFRHNYRNVRFRARDEICGYIGRPPLRPRPGDACITLPLR